VRAGGPLHDREPPPLHHPHCQLQPGAQPRSFTQQLRILPRCSSAPRTRQAAAAKDAAGPRNGPLQATAGCWGWVTEIPATCSPCAPASRISTHWSHWRYMGASRAKTGSGKVATPEQEHTQGAMSCCAVPVQGLAAAGTYRMPNYFRHQNVVSDHNSVSCCSIKRFVHLHVQWGKQQAQVCLLALDLDTGRAYRHHVETTSTTLSGIMWRPD
jgi:hypothetical protein